MPIYEYTCKSCGHEFEELIRAGETPACPKCHKTNVAKSFSVPAAHTSGAASSCPARETGMCGDTQCGGGGCGLTGLG